MMRIKVSKSGFVGEDELVFRFSRSGGAGGQNVNKVNTKVTLLFDVAASRGLSAEEKEEVLRKAVGRCDGRGRLRIVCQKHREQGANRRQAVERLAEVLRECLKKKKVRRKSKVPRAAVERRLKEKKKRRELKRQRGEKDFE